MKSTITLFSRHALYAAVIGLGVSLAATAQPSGGTGATTGSTGGSAGATSGPGAAGTATSGPGARSGTARSNNNSLASADRKFVENAAKGGMAEVQLGKLAQEKASTDPVKQFGARMVQDHSKANEELMSIASSKGVQPPAALDRKHQKEMDRLQKLSGAEFDRAYMSHMVDDHKKDVSDFKKQANSGKDPELKAFAAKTLPTLQEHLQLAQTTHDAAKAAGRSGGRNAASGASR